MKYSIMKFMRRVAVDIQHKVNEPAVRLLFSRRRNQRLKCAWYNFWRNLSEEVFYRCDQYCCSIDGSDLHYF